MTVLEKRKKGARAGRPKDPSLAQRREGINVQIDFSNAQWWTKDGVAYIERTAPAGVLRSARSYVRNGKVLDVDIQPGLVETKVQGRRKVPYHVRLYFPQPGDNELREIKRRLSERALYGALLLAGEMPVAMEDIFLASGSPFLPLGTGRERFFCSCPEPHDFCKHVVATLYTAAGIFDRNPFLLLKLRGFDSDDLLASILVPRGNGFADRGSPEALADSVELEKDNATSLADFFKIDPLPLDAAFYGNDSICRAIEEFRNNSIVKTDIPASLVPLFDFPLWRGETSFRESIDPYYESARKSFRKN